MDYVVFRDWDITFSFDPTKNVGSIFIRAYFPNREDDDRTRKEDHERRWARSKRGGFEYAERERFSAYEEISPYATFGERTYFHGAVPIQGWREIPDWARRSREDLTEFVYALILELSDHEIRENLYVYGQRVLDPHGPVRQTIPEPANLILGRKK